MPRIVIADEDINYIRPLAKEFVRALYKDADIELITSTAYFETLFSKPQKAELLVISERFCSANILIHDIACVCVLTEQPDKFGRTSPDESDIYANTAP